MKALGLSFGRKMGNSEIMVKQVLKAMKESGFETEFIRVNDLDLKDCTGCMACVISLMGGKNGSCVLKDDFHIIEEAFLESDAVVMCSPIFCLSPTGTYKTLCDRMGPSHDFAFRKNARVQGKEAGLPEEKLADPRSFKKRVAALMTVGGARTKHWTSLGVPSMFELTWNGLQVVDTYNAYAAMDYQHMVLNKKLMERMTRMGKNLAYAAENVIPEDYWCGDTEGICPVCHNDLLTILHDQNKVECPVCGIEGELKIENGEIKAVFTEEQKRRSRMYYEGKLEHYIEVRDATKNQISSPDLKEILKEYQTV